MLHDGQCGMAGMSALARGHSLNHSLRISNKIDEVASAVDSVARGSRGRAISCKIARRVNEAGKWARNIYRQT